MLRKFLDYQLSLAEKNRFFHFMKPLISAGDTFLYEPHDTTKNPPHIRDAVDLKRWMFMVIIALIPAIIIAVWNTGLQSIVYSSGDYQLMDEYLSSLGSMEDYFSFAFKNDRYLSILAEGAYLFFPVMIVSYAVGGLVEGIFACIRRHDVAEGFLVTGMLYPLVLPPTIPLWMVAVGVAVGVVLAKELFGGTGMNILNPALSCRTFLFFTFPNRMSGDVWVGGNPVTVRNSLVKMNEDAGKGALDGYTQATSLAKFNVSPEIKQVHVNAIASNNLGSKVDGYDTVAGYFGKWAQTGGQNASLGELTQEQLKTFVTSPFAEGGLGLSPGSYEDAYHFASMRYDIGDMHSNWQYFLGNKLGCFGETSVLAILIGALIIIYTAVGSWKTMAAMGLGAFLMASCFEFGSKFFGADAGAWTPAQFGMPAYKHLILGGFAFGCVYMATDPVSSPGLSLSKWIYGLLIGVVVIIIRVINPAYPEGVMLAIILGNVFGPLIDYYVALNHRRNYRVKREAVA